MSKINDLNTELEEYVEDAEAIKTKIQTVATATITMSGVDITSTVYDDRVINITSVTGDVEIEISASPLL